MTRRYAFTNILLLCIVAAAADKTTSLGSKLRHVDDEAVSRATCVNHVLLNFENAGNGARLTGGQYITNQWLSNYGLTISGSGSGVQIVNTTNPGTNKFLASPNRLCATPGQGVGLAGGPGKPGQNCNALGNAIYVAGKYYVARTITFNFNQVRYVQTMGVLDIKGGAKVNVQVKTSDGKVTTISTVGLGDNAYQVVKIYKTAVKSITVTMSTGAITHLDFCGGTTVSTPTKPASSPQAAPVPGLQNLCQKRSYIDFEAAANGTKLSGGQYVSNEWLKLGVSVLAYAIQDGFTPNSKPRLFDTSKPGLATSLGSPNKLCPSGGTGVGLYGQPGQLGQNCIALGKVLIVQHAAVSTPDSSTGGAVFTFRFTAAKRVQSFGLFDVPLKDKAVVTVTLTSGAKKVVYAAGRGKNGYQTVNLGVANAIKVTVYVPTTGAISHLDVCTTSSPVSAPVQSRVEDPSPESIPIEFTPAPSPYATVDDNGMFKPVAPSEQSRESDQQLSPAPSPYATVDDNGMFGRHTEQVETTATP